MATLRQAEPVDSHLIAGNCPLRVDLLFSRPTRIIRMCAMRAEYGKSNVLRGNQLVAASAVKAAGLMSRLSGLAPRAET